MGINQYYLVIAILCAGANSLVHATQAEVKQSKQAAHKTIDNSLNKFLHAATKTGNVALIQKLFAGNATPDIESPEIENVRTFYNVPLSVHISEEKLHGTANTALMVAAENDTTKVIQPLLAAGANLNAQNIEGETAVMLAAAKGHNNMLKELIAAGADKAICSKAGKTARDYAKNKDVYDKAVAAGLKELAEHKAYLARQAEAKKIIEEEKQLDPNMSNIIAEYAYGPSVLDLPNPKN